MNRIALVALVVLVAPACGGGSLMEPSLATDAQIQGLVRERGTGEFVEFATETFEAVYSAETLRAPEWTVTGGTLMGNGNSAKWQLPNAGEHTISIKVFTVDGRELTANWTVKIAHREG